MNSKFKFITDFRFIVSLYVLFSILASLQAITHKKKEYDSSGMQYTEYNNYIIFKQSYFHLIENKDLYIAYPEECWDLYKYSPTFSLFFGIFAYLPDGFGLVFWNLLNALLLLFAVYYIPGIEKRKKGLILLVSLLELLTSMQNEQSNGMIAGLIILSYALLERKHYFFAVLCIVFSVYIKLFGIVAFALFLLYPEKIKLAAYSIFWFLILLVLPLLVIDLEQYTFIFSSWGDMLKNDHSSSLGYSVMGWLKTWFGLGFNKLLIVILGGIVFCLPLLKIQLYKEMKFKLLMLSSVLLWIVIFNHKAESPTFVIALSGIALWFFTSEKNKINSVLFAFAFIFTSLSPTDLFPRFIRDELFEPYVMKAVPCIFVWFKIMYDLMKMKRVKEIV